MRSLISRFAAVMTFRTNPMLVPTCSAMSFGLLPSSSIAFTSWSVWSTPSSFLLISSDVVATLCPGSLKSFFFGIHLHILAFLMDQGRIFTSCAGNHRPLLRGVWSPSASPVNKRLLGRFHQAQLRRRRRLGHSLCSFSKAACTLLSTLGRVMRAFSDVCVYA